MCQPHNNSYSLNLFRHSNSQSMSSKRLSLNNWLSKTTHNNSSSYRNSNSSNTLIFQHNKSFTTSLNKNNSLISTKCNMVKHNSSNNIYRRQLKSLKKAKEHLLFKVMKSLSLDRISLARLHHSLHQIPSMKMLKGVISHL